MHKVSYIIIIIITNRHHQHHYHHVHDHPLALSFDDVLLALFYPTSFLSFTITRLNIVMWSIRLVEEEGDGVVNSVDGMGMTPLQWAADR